jgi:hypothetical protein
MPAPRILGTTVSFGIPSSESTMVAQNVSVNYSSNKAEAKNIFGGTTSVIFFGKKAEFDIEGFVTSTNSATVGGTYTISNLTGFTGLSGVAYIDEVTLTKSSEDFSKIKYKVVQRDGIS